MTSPRRTIGLWAGAVGIAVLAFFAGVFVRSCLEQSTWKHLTGELWEWQTLIVGVLALIAGVGTILTTRHAAAEQVGAAQRQTDEMRTMERRRIVREAYAFYVMMDAATESVLADVEGARKMIAASTAEPSRDRPRIAYEARTKVKQAGFPELRTACLRYGSQQVTSAFLRLDKTINDLSSASKVRPHWLGGNAGMIGEPEGIPLELDHIEALAKGLRDRVGPRIERCGTLLAETPEPDFS
jgi:hypothetical protein